MTSNPCFFSTFVGKQEANPAPKQGFFYSDGLAIRSADRGDSHESIRANPLAEKKNYFHNCANRRKPAIRNVLVSRSTIRRKNGVRFWEGRSVPTKVCSSKRPPKLEPRSVRTNEVFENLACRVSPE